MRITHRSVGSLTACKAHAWAVLQLGRDNALQPTLFRAYSSSASP
jgi:hypothetical protein